VTAVRVRADPADPALTRRIAGFLGNMFHKQQPPPQQQQMAPQKSGMGMGGALALGAGGLLGGMVLGEAMEVRVRIRVVGRVLTS
jgi:hypothetical protein